MIKYLVFWAKGYTMKLITVFHFYLHYLQEILKKKHQFKCHINLSLREVQRYHDKRYRGVIILILETAMYIKRLFWP